MIARLIFIIFSLTIVSQHQLLSQTPNLINGVAVPADFPSWKPVINNTTSPGYIWINNWTGSPYIIMFKNDGTPAFYQRVEQRSRDFKPHWNGKISRRLRPNPNGFLIYDNNYNLLDTVFAQNAYITDEHELHIAPNGNYLIIVIEYKNLDLSSIGGQENVQVKGNHIQELDSDLNVVFEWICWDHINIEDTYSSITGSSLDHIHMNSIAVDYDGHIVASCRHLNECFKIHRTTGEFIWRFGGKNNEFSFVNDSFEIAHQHSFRPVPGEPNSYTIFDNGNGRSPRFSRAVEFQLDTGAMTATKTWEYRHEPEIYSHFMGNTQRLLNGNTLVNFAIKGSPKAVEVSPAGEVVYEADFEGEIQTYRSFRYEWNGQLSSPYLLVENLAHRQSLIFNKFGDTNVNYYRIYADKANPPVTLFDSTENTWYNINKLDNNETYYFKVSAVDFDGKESEFSEVKSAYITQIENNIDLIKNGDFSGGLSDWEFTTEGSAIAEGSVTDSNYFVVEITNPGSIIHNIQFKQTGITLYTGLNYIFSFDAYVDASRIIEAKVGQNSGPWTNYSKIGYTYLKQGLHNYEYEFTFEDATDADCRAVFNFGLYSGNAQIKNIKLIQKIPGLSVQSHKPQNDELIKVYPNPATDYLNVELKDLAAQNCIISIVNLNQQVLLTRNINKNELNNTLKIDTSQLPSGIYLLKITLLNNSVYKEMFVRKVIKH